MMGNFLGVSDMIRNRLRRDSGGSSHVDMVSNQADVLVRSPGRVKTSKTNRAETDMVEESFISLIKITT